MGMTVVFRRLTGLRTKDGLCRTHFYDVYRPRRRRLQSSSPVCSTDL